MHATAVQGKPKHTAANGTPKLISWEEFQRRYLNREDKFKYEWLNGIVLKTKRTMDYSQFFIIENLDLIFNNLKAEKKVSGILIHEGDIFFGKNHRRPDVCYLSKEQIARTAHGKNQVPKFVIEIISTNDQMNDAEDKLENYLEAGVEVIWQIFPKQKTVQVHTGKNSVRCKGEDMCSAAPVLPDLKCSANAIFQKPELPEGE